MLQDRQGEGGGLAAAGLGDAQKVLVASRAGMVSAWIGVGISNFRACNARSSGSDKPRSAKVVWVKTKECSSARPSLMDERRL